MGGLTITAQFPLGTYLGHVDVGKTSAFPDTSRLYSALVHAASKGSTAVVVDDDLRMSPATMEALKWLEEHPPQFLHLGDVLPVSQRPASAWRPDGVFDKRQQSLQERRILKLQSGAHAVRGFFSWTWLEAPEHVVQTCEEVSADVSCLGEADSPVRLRVTREAPLPTHRLDPHRTAFPEPGGVSVRTPVGGRLDELDRAHEAGRGMRPPTPAADRHSTSQLPRAVLPASRAIRSLTYRSIQRTLEAPWTQAVVLPVTSPPMMRTQLEARQEAVGWAVALHRAIAASMGDGAPPSITGTYQPGAIPPANRCAIHYLPAEAPVSFSHPTGSYLILLPYGLPGRDLRLLLNALESIKSVWRQTRRGRSETDGSGTSVVTGSPELVSAGDFWRPPASGMRRLWAPRVPLVPEVRAHRRRGWDLDDVALLSVGHVWRDWLGAERASRNQLIEAVVHKGVHVYDAHLVLDSNVSRYVHKTPSGVVVQPYTCVLDLGTLANDRAPVAIGQTRHLGGGMLYPIDIRVDHRAGSAS